MPRKRRLNVHLYVIPTCNLKCIHCYSDALPLNSQIDRILSIEEMANIIADLCDNYDTALDVEGGEFFVRKDITTLFDILPAQYLRHITLTTNGVTKINMNPRIFGDLDEFRVSVEGHTDELQRSIRGISLRPVIKTCKWLMDNGVPVTLRITLHQKNHLYLAEMLDYYLNLGFSRFSFYEFQASGRGVPYANDYALNTAQMEDVLKQLVTTNLDDAIDVFKVSLSSRRSHMIQEYSESLRHKGLQTLDISGAASLTINYDGVLGVCPWNVTNENIGSLQINNFSFNIGELIDTGRLDHSCSHCSANRIQKYSLLPSA